MPVFDLGVQLVEEGLAGLRAGDRGQSGRPLPAGTEAMSWQARGPILFQLAMLRAD